MGREETITIDVERLRTDLCKECFGASFGGNYGGALLESSDVESASPGQLIAIAQNYGLDLRKYQVV